jgi:hypothetical protein
MLGYRIGSNSKEFDQRLPGLGSQENLLEDCLVQVMPNEELADPLGITSAIFFHNKFDYIKYFIVSRCESQQEETVEPGDLFINIYIIRLQKTILQISNYF